MKYSVKIYLMAALTCLCPWPVGAVDVEVRDVPTRTVLEGLARSGNVNLIVDDSVKGNLTMTLHDVRLDEALQAIADSQGLYYDASGPIRTMTSHRGQDGVKNFHTWQLRYADPETLKKAVQAAVPEADVRCHEDTNTLVVGGTAQTQTAVQSLVRRLDVPSRQVDVCVEVASVDDSLLKQTGVEWNWSTVEGGADHEVFSLAGTIHALEEKGKARILASPHMVASNGRKAHILIGDKVPVQTEHLSGKETAVSTTYEEAGIKLTYTPQIHPDNSVTAAIFAEVSTPIFVPEMKAYRIATRQARTVVRLRDGEPLVIGGLIRREEIEHFRRVPLLADLPLLGKLFRYHYCSHKNTEIVLVLKSHVLL